MLPENDLHHILTSAQIGFALYDNQYLNDRYTAFSSQKIAMYCKHGLPFISMRNECYEGLTNQVSCCELVDNFAQLSSAIEKIKNEYTTYRKATFEAYSLFYNFDNQSSKLIDFLKSH